MEIIGLLPQSLSNREIADDLAEGTLKNYVSRILAKRHAVGRVQAINLARRHQLI